MQLGFAKTVINHIYERKQYYVTNVSKNKKEKSIWSSYDVSSQFHDDCKSQYHLQNSSATGSQLFGETTVAGELLVQSIASNCQFFGFIHYSLAPLNNKLDQNSGIRLTLLPHEGQKSKLFSACDSKQ